MGLVSSKHASRLLNARKMENSVFRAMLVALVERPVVGTPRDTVCGPRRQGEAETGPDHSGVAVVKYRFVPRTRPRVAVRGEPRAVLLDLMEFPFRDVRHPDGIL